MRMSEMWEEQDCLGNCATCGNTDCAWYDDWMEGEEDDSSTAYKETTKDATRCGGNNE